jgi:hypothetical protein
MTLTEHMGAVAEAAGARGAGARFVARRLKKDVLVVRLGTRLAPDAASALAQRVLASCGRLLATIAVPGGQALRGVMGTGLGGLNLAVVTLTVTAADGGATVLVRGAAKEGLIKQRGGRRAAEEIVSRWLAEDPTAWPETTVPD